MTKASWFSRCLAASSLVAALLTSAGCGSSSGSASDATADGARSDGSTGSPADLGPGSHDLATTLDTTVGPDVARDGAPSSTVDVPSSTTDVPADGTQLADSGLARDSVVAPNDAQTSANDGGSANDAPRTNPSEAGVEAAVSAPDAGASADASNPVPSGKIGVIALMQSVQTLPAPVGTMVSSGAVAQFGFSAGSNSCTSTTSGDCQLYTCTSSTSTPQTGLVEAGSVTITGLSSKLELPYLTAQSAYMTYTSNYLWTTSAPATLTVTGSTNVPAFTMSLVVPTPIVVTSPVAQSGATGSTYTLSRSNDLSVVWTGGVDGSVTVNMGGDASAASPVSIVCSVSAAAGRLTVPASFMSRLGSSGSFSAGVNNFATKNVGDWLMQFQASDLRAQGTVTFSHWEAAPGFVVPGLFVQNDGPGISPGNAARIFEPFFTTARDRGGTGMGLTVARSLLRAYGASIDLVPTQKGACFRLSLQVADA